MVHFPLVSVLVPIYNTSKFLVQCIESIICQSYSNIEIILVDDGSTDNSYDICDSYRNKDKRITLIHQDNLGLVNARKTAIRYAKGEYVLCIDSDDYIDKDMITKMLKLAIENNADIVCTGYIKEKKNGSFQRENFFKSGIYTNNNLEKIYKSLIYSGKFYIPGITPFVWNKLIKKNLYLKFQNKVPEEITRGEDAAVIYPLLTDVKCVVIDNEYKPYHYRKNQKSICNSYDKEHFKRQLILFKYLDNSIQSDDLRNQLLFYKLFALKFGIESYLRNSKENAAKQSIFLSKTLLPFNLQQLMRNIERNDKILSIDVIKAMKRNFFFFYILNYKKKSRNDESVQHFRLKDLNKNSIFANVIFRLFGGRQPSENKVYFSRYKYYYILKKRYERILSKYPRYKENSSPNEKIIWWCWLQGLGNAPSLCKSCLLSLRRELKDFKINIVTEENVWKLVEIPDYIREKYESGIISHTHFTDILRTCLLIKYGGTWIDSTVYCTGYHNDLFNNPLFYYSNTMRGDKGLIFSSWVLSAHKNEPILLSLRDILFDYWKTHKSLYHYFLYHFFATMVIEEYPDLKSKVPVFSNIPSHIMQRELFCKYSKERFAHYKQMADFHKLTYKNNIRTDLHETLYEKLLNEGIKNEQ